MLEEIIKNNSVMMVKQRINMWNLLFKEKDWIICTHSLYCYTSAKEVGGKGEGSVKLLLSFVILHEVVVAVC